MANICFNYLKVTGKEARVQEFKNKFCNEYYNIARIRKDDNLKKRKDELLLKSNQIIREVPVTINNVVHVYVIYSCTGYSFQNFIQLSIDDYKTCINPCSTKWGCSSDLFDITIIRTTNDVFECAFDTNWNGADKVIIQMSKEFPDLKFYYTYEEDSDYLAVVLSCYNGNVIRKEAPDDNDIVYREFLKDNDMQTFLKKCPHCGCLLDENDIEDNVCPNCDENLK